MHTLLIFLKETHSTGQQVIIHLIRVCAGKIMHQSTHGGIIAPRARHIIAQKGRNVKLRNGGRRDAPLTDGANRDEGSV